MGAWSDHHCHSYILIFYLWCLKTTSSDRFLLASPPLISKLPGNPLLVRPTSSFHYFCPSSLTQKTTSLEINLLWSHLWSVPAIDKELYLYRSQWELHDWWQSLVFILQCTEGVQKMDHIIQRIPDSLCLGHFIVMTFQSIITDQAEPYLQL